ncbi:MAG: hypothetical protein ACFFAN_20915 [Promethearchaeota archaeon]
MDAIAREIKVLVQFIIESMALEIILIEKARNTNKHIGLSLLSLLIE